MNHSKHGTQSSSNLQQKNANSNNSNTNNNMAHEMKKANYDKGFMYGNSNQPN